MVKPKAFRYKGSGKLPLSAALATSQASDERKSQRGHVPRL